MFLRPFIIALAAFLVLRAGAADHSDATLDRRFADTIRPFLETYCLDCHDHDTQKGDLDLSLYNSRASVAAGYRHWDTVLEKLKAGEMPPEKAKTKPDRELRQKIIEWIAATRLNEARRNAGDPGPVLARRLSNAEYDYTVRDLTGQDLRPTREFPVDPANEDGFDNSGESLSMSPALLKKYLAAAREVSEHLVLKPEGFAFAPDPTVTDTDRDKYAVRQIMQFYWRQPTNYTDYFIAAWRYKNRAALGEPKMALSQCAADNRVSPKYLATVWAALTGKQENIGPLAALQALWRELPGAKEPPEKVRADCEVMSRFITTTRDKVQQDFPNLKVRGLHEGSQSLVLWKDRQYATHRRSYGGGALELKQTSLPTNSAAARAMIIPAEAAQREPYEAAFKHFCDVFPDAFYVAERARIYLDPKEEKGKVAGRYLSAGFHSQMGYFRDDEPLYDLMLSEAEQHELDTLWRELDFITLAPMRQHRNFLWFERTDSSFMLGPEFAFARPEDKDTTSESSIHKLSEVYLGKVKSRTTNELAIRVVKEHFENVSANIRAVEQARLAAEPSHLAALQTFAERAYRRPLTPAERADLMAFYKNLREKDGLDHEDAMRDSIVSVLMSPYFFYLVDVPQAGSRARPLTDYELASRLSYFLWSSMPDEKLLAAAAAGDLHRPRVLAAEARRMLQDDRAQALATEFGGNWLDFRRFQEHNAVDRERFPAFDNALREAMFEEPIRFFLSVIRADRPVLDFLYGDYTFVNPALAKHYGVPNVHSGSNDWVRVDHASQYGRGGLMPMAVFLTKNAPGDRTSPVKRGYWVVRRLLGERIPPPPPNVAVLPADESKMGDLTLREALARHREDKNCATCHARFDALGLVFEGYGPVGETRERDLGGRPVDIRANFPGGQEGAGLAGLEEYIRGHRQDDFLDNLCRKLLAYGLGRGLMLSDEIIVQQMRAKLAKDGYRFSGLIEDIVTSPQFLTKRGQGDLAKQ